MASGGLISIQCLFSASFSALGLPFCDDIWIARETRDAPFPSHALRVRLTQTNAVLRSHAETIILIISRTFKFFHLKSSF